MNAPPVSEHGPNFDGLLSVEDKIRQLNRPVRVGIIAAISELSEGTLRKKIEQGQLQAFKRSGITVVEPLDFWNTGTFPAKPGRTL